MRVGCCRKPFGFRVARSHRARRRFSRSLHDRKMCILGLCALMDLEHRPQVVNQAAGQLLPAAILLFNGLKRAYACRAEHDNDEDEDDEDGEEEDDAGGSPVLF